MVDAPVAPGAMVTLRSFPVLFGVPWITVPVVTGSRGSNKPCAKARPVIASDSALIVKSFFMLSPCRMDPAQGRTTGASVEGCSGSARFAAEILFGLRHVNEEVRSREAAGRVGLGDQARRPRSG